MAGHAARDLGLNADEVVLVSSTDPGVQHVSELHLLNPDGTPVDASEVPLRVHATTPDNDVLAKAASARFGNDPTDPAFGADVLRAPLGPIWNAHSQAFEDGPALAYMRHLINVGRL